MTLAKIKSDLKAKHPTLKTGSEETGYQELIGADYDAVIDQWAEAAYAQELNAKAEAEKVAAKEALLGRLGITSDEAKLLLG
jgi:hypothetical protein